MDERIDWERFAEDIYTWLWMQFRLPLQSVPDQQKEPNDYDNPLILKTVVRAVNINQLLCRKAFSGLFEYHVNSSVSLLQSEASFSIFMREIIEDLFEKSERGGTYDVFTKVVLSLTVPTEIVLFLESKRLRTFIRSIPRLWNRFFTTRLHEEFRDGGGLEKLQEHIDKTTGTLPHLNSFISKHCVPYTEEDLFAKYKDFIASWEQSSSGLRPVEIAEVLKSATEKQAKEHKNFRGYLWEYHPRFGMRPQELVLAEELFRNPDKSEDFLQQPSSNLTTSERRVQRHIKIKSMWLMFHHIFLSDPVAKAEGDAEYAAAMEAAAAAAAARPEISAEAEDEDEAEARVEIAAVGGTEAEVMTEEEAKAASEEALRKRKVAIIQFLRKKLAANKNATPTVRLPGIDASSPWPLDRAIQTHVKLKSKWLRCPQSPQREARSLSGAASVSRADAAVASGSRTEESEERSLHGENSPAHKEGKFRDEDSCIATEETISDKGENLESKKVKAGKVGLSKKKRKAKSKDKGKWKPKDRRVPDKDRTDKVGHLSTENMPSEKEDNHVPPNNELQVEESPALKETGDAKLEAEISHSIGLLTVQDEDYIVSEREEVTEKDYSHVPEERKSPIEESPEFERSNDAETEICVRPNKKTAQDKDCLKFEKERVETVKVDFPVSKKGEAEEIPGSRKSKDGKADIEVSVGPKQQMAKDEDCMIPETEKAETEEIDSTVCSKMDTEENPRSKKPKDGKSEIEVCVRPKQKMVKDKDSLISEEEKVATEKVDSPVSKEEETEESPVPKKVKDGKSKTKVCVRPKIKVKKESCEDKPSKYIPNIELAIEMEKRFFAEKCVRMINQPVINPTNEPVQMQESMETRRQTREERMSKIPPTPSVSYGIREETRLFFDRFAEDVFTILCGYFKVPAKFFHNTTNNPNEYKDDILSVVARTVCVNQLMLRSWFYKYFADAIQDEDFKFFESPNKVIILICDAIFDLFDMSRKSTTNIFHLFIESLTVPMELILFLASRNRETQTEYFPVC